MDSFMTTTIAIIFLLIIAGFINILSKKVKISYTILLVIGWLILVPISKLGAFWFLSSFSLTPDLLFYVFLPILLFESAYNIKYREISQNSRSIWVLAIIGLMISTVIIGFWGKFVLDAIGFDIPLGVVLLFGAIVSSTDPVAVLALFKEFWAPKRLTLIFEGESLFNDGTGLALFLVIYEIMQSGIMSEWIALTGIGQFISMIIGGIIVGSLFGFGFAHIIKRIKNNEPVEILLTMLMAHLTFVSADLLSEYFVIGGFAIKISWVIATAYAAIIMGNYGRTKISPKVEEAMERFWSFFAFAANSLVFILIGLMLANISAPIQSFIWPVAVLILVTTIARALSVYIPVSILNQLKWEKHIPRSRQHLLAWGSLRWALAFMMVLLISDNFTVPGWSLDLSVKEFLMIAVSAKILYSLFIKGTTITSLLKKLKIVQKSNLETFEVYQSELLIYHKILEKIEFMNDHYHIGQDCYLHLTSKFAKKLEDTETNIRTFVVDVPDAHNIIFRVISLEALGVEKQYVKRLYHTNEIAENLYLHLMYKIDTQISRITEDQPQIKWIDEKTTSYDILTKVNMLLHRGIGDYKQAYIKNRTKEVITSRVLRYLRSLKQIAHEYPTSIIDEVISLYEQFHVMAKERMSEISREYKQETDMINNKLFEKWLMDQEEKIINDLRNKEIISAKTYDHFMNEIEHVIHERITK